MENRPCQTVRSGSSTDMSELSKELEKLTEDAENRCVQLTWMVYDLVKLRTDLQTEARMRELEEAWSRCRTAVFGEPEPLPEMKSAAQDMENTENKERMTTSPVSAAMENLLKELDSLSNGMDQLALRTHLMQCDLIVWVNHPDKAAFLRKIQEEVKQQQL